MSETTIKTPQQKYSDAFRQQALEDFTTACLSREASLLGRKEVLTGKAKFGIFGAGKELPQVAMAREFQTGDFRAGYYRDQTFVFAAGLGTPQQFFAQLYAHADEQHEPFSAGRQMNSHFATPLINKQGQWLDLKDLKNVSSDISPTGGQMARALGLALASKKYRESEELAFNTGFSNGGNEVCFCTIGDASTSEGAFWETINAAGVTQVPLAVFVWDDGYGISVPTKYQTTKGSISKVLAGFQRNEDGHGFEIYTVKAWDYASLRQVFAEGIAQAREKQIPCLFHVQEVTQPQGHSTSGSHGRYKSKERLQWEKDQDGIESMKRWMIEANISTEGTLKAIQKQAKKDARLAAKEAWKAFTGPVQENLHKTTGLLRNLASALDRDTGSKILQQVQVLEKEIDPTHRDILRTARLALPLVNRIEHPLVTELRDWVNTLMTEGKTNYVTHLYSSSPKAAVNIPEVAPIYSDSSIAKNGYEILNTCFDYHLTTNPSVFAFGEDVGKIGDVNQGFAGMQDKHGEKRVFDTGIREWTIMGQAIGMAMRGLRPIAEIQYLDYLIYGISPLSDDLATLRYRTNNIQQAPAIIRTRGHRLEGIWHTGSPIQMILGSMRGICVLVPRNMTQAAGFYNTMLQSDDPALIIECLNGYRLKEQMPDNLTEFTVPVGTPEILQEGTDVTLVTYGSCVRVAQEAIEQLEANNISVELIDVQSLLPFDINHQIVESLKKTNRLVCLDEDFSGGGTAYLLQKILTEQKGYYHLDSEPLVICAEDVRCPYGSDGDYFVKPSAEDIFEKIYALMNESEPSRFPSLY
ncbi:MAG: thiamine pyrophosphate-dependent enzyme [Saprospiraceae bacterium]|nr:thiamine pyrophosphate-dependent enzyme [Saprospiraceae bacterium]